VTDGTNTPGADVVPFSDALLEVVKGLKDEPMLLFGIGAGIVLIAVIAFTTSLAIVIVVAVVLVLALTASLVARARSAQSGKGKAGRRLVARLGGARVRHSDIQNVDKAEGDIEAELDAENAIFEGSNVQNVGGRRRRRKD
jgi:hypothetical protein